MNPVKKPRWQQSTALVSLTTCGAMTGFAFAHGTVADLTSPTAMPAHLLARSKPIQPEPTSDSTLRSAIVKAATSYLRMARDNSPAEMQALIWDKDSVNGADHGESCAAFASLVLEMGAKATGLKSWVSGGGTYPWPLYGWADVRVDQNPDSPGVVSIQQDAQENGRWHPLGDGYTPQPGDWVLFDGHVEVVTKYAGGVLYTIGGDSMPNLSVNAHQYRAPLAKQGVVGFVNNGDLVSTTSDDEPVDLGQTAIPGLLSDVLSPAGRTQPAGPRAQQTAAAPVTQAAVAGAAAIPGLVQVTVTTGAGHPAQPSAAYRRNRPPATQVPGTTAQQAFISEVAPGAVAAQRTYGIPAAVTIAQAIDESGWGQSQLASQDHNLFGIKGTGPAGSVDRPTEEYQDGSWVTETASFRVYHSVAESIADHSRLLATGEAYQQAMADRNAPDAFANDLTGVYATDPNYGANLIAIMKLYNLYRYDPSPSAARTAAPQVRTQVTSQVATVDHAADVPGLQQTSAPGGSRSPGTATSQPGQGVPRPRGTMPAAGTLASGAHDGNARGGTRPAGTTRNGTGNDDGSRHTTTRGWRTVSGSGNGAGRTGGSARGGTSRGEARIPGLTNEYPATAVAPAPASTGAGHAAPIAAGASALVTAELRVRRRAKRYTAQMPSVVVTDITTMAKQPLARAKPMYQDVARRDNVPWQVLAACDWMQCKGEPRYSPVRGERLGSKNPDGTRYRTKSAALEQCAADLIALSYAVYRVDLTAPRFLSVLELAQVFAAFRWGGLLKEHRVSAMEFPYSVEGLTVQHLDLPWPDISEPNAPDKPGARFRMPFGAVPVVLSLDYPAVA